MLRTDVHGIRELQRELRQVDKALPRELRKAGLSAAKLVAEEAQKRARSQGGVAEKSAPGVKPFAEQRRAGIRIDGSKHPYIFGAEFGSHQYSQFKGWTGNRWTDPEGLNVGYFVHPAIRASVSRVVDEYGDAVDALMKKAFPD